MSDVVSSITSKFITIQETGEKVFLIKFRANESDMEYRWSSGKDGLKPWAKRMFTVSQRIMDKNKPVAFVAWDYKGFQVDKPHTAYHIGRNSDGVFGEYAFDYKGSDAFEFYKDSKGKFHKVK